MQRSVSPSLLIFVGFVALAARAPQVSAQDEMRNLKDKLLELSAIEAEIEQKLEQQASRDGEIQQLERDLKFTREFNIGRERLQEKGRRELRAMEQEAVRRIAALEGAIEEGRIQLDAARRGIELSAPLLLHDGRLYGPANQLTLTMALVQMRYRRRAQMAVEQILRTEEQRDAGVTRRDWILALSEQHARFAGMKISELRERHGRISSELESHHIAAQSSKQDIIHLDHRQRALNELIAKLSSGAKVDSRLVSASSTPPEVQDEPTADAREFDPTRAPGGENRRWRINSARIHALGDGTVLFSGQFLTYRHILVIDHGDDWASVYGNMTSCNLKEDHRVTAGMVLGSFEQGTAGFDEPFWIEVRLDTAPVQIDRLPGLNSDWADWVFTQ